MFSRSLSIIIPAYNEERNIRATCAGMARVVEKHIPDYEILVIDDASRDRTAEVVRELQNENPRIQLFRNPVNRGLGYNYRAGILKAENCYAIMVPGDNEMVADSLEEVFKQIGSTDIIICYSENPEVRPPWRRLISNVFTRSLNFLFGLKIRYYNGPSVIRTDLAREFLPATSSFAYMAVILVELLKSGATYQEMSFRLRPREFGTTKAFHPKNVLSVIRDVLSLFWRVQICRQVKPIVPAPSLPPAGVMTARRLPSEVGCARTVKGVVLTEGGFKSKISLP